MRYPWKIDASRESIDALDLIVGDGDVDGCVPGADSVEALVGPSKNANRKDLRDARKLGEEPREMNRGARGLDADRVMTRQRVLEAREDEPEAALLEVGVRCAESCLNLKEEGLDAKKVKTKLGGEKLTDR